LNVGFARVGIEENFSGSTVKYVGTVAAMPSVSSAQSDRRNEEPSMAIHTMPEFTPPVQVIENRTDRLGGRGASRFWSLFGLPSRRRLAQAALLIPAIRHWEREFERISDRELMSLGQRLRGRARGGEPLDHLLPEAFGAACVAARRTVGFRPFDVQLAGGVILHHGALAEIATGEGKTLVAVPPAFLNALVGKGVHVTTVNDYLARRDAEWTRPIYEMLGLKVGCLQMRMPDGERQAAYRCDVTYGTASEFGFDFLRDRLRTSSEGPERPFWSAWTDVPTSALPDPRVQRGHHYALVDEADNIFIDEAKTPLVISGPTRRATPEEQVVYRWASDIAKAMVRGRHFTLDEKRGKIELSDEGKQLIRYSKPPFGPHSHAMDKLHEHVERAIQAWHRFRRDQHYLVEKDQVIIIDESTGRRMPDRHWRDGLHQAVEVKENVPVTFPADHAAQITFQSYFRLYAKRSGMSGTAVQNFWELRRVYKLWVVCVPTNRPARRLDLPDRVFPTETAKFDAVAEEIERLQSQGRPVLVGTRSVERSEMLSERLKRRGIEHQVLSARHHEHEAKVVEQAGLAGRVTIATNMAGRGTDIKLGPGVAARGGLHVIGTERHEARRIDRQLVGRAGRQGDPGSSQFFLSLEDDLLEALGPKRHQQLLAIGRAGGDRDWQAFLPWFHLAQRKMERRHYRQRVDLMIYERQRQEVLKDLGADPYVD
jgi:preprotein translocase subunit SecA